MNELDLIISSPNGIKVKEAISSLNIKALNGYITILPHHAPLISALQTCVITYIINGKSLQKIIGQGVVRVFDNQVMIMTDYFSDIDKNVDPIVERANYINNIINGKIESGDHEFKKLYVEFEDEVLRYNKKNDQ
jgi:F-type H+-transporting ATPase subunit epsilon